ncbi:cell surface mannoprotein [Physcia stellaris]|nr:cell surface mannoprotein [Physcia stellaris]
MLRLRRYRAFLIFAIIVIGALYHFTSLGGIENTGAASVEGLKNFGGHRDESSTATPSEPGNSLEDAVEDVKQSEKQVYDSVVSAVSNEFAVTSSTTTTSTTAVEEPESIPTKKTLSADADEVDGSTLEIDEPANSDDATSTGPEAAQPNLNSQNGQGMLETIGEDTIPKIHWKKQKEHFPLPTESIIQLPTGRPKTIPKIQYDFPDESAKEKVDREKKLDIIKKTFMFSWSGYKKNAWMHDELSPVSGQYRDPFCGWAATLVDSLDTLWMMGLKSEFEDATKAVANIDFTASIRNDIPLFETVIRYLGGLIAAYDLGGSKYRILLDKAVGLAEILIGAFDTPNRMPMTFYLWKPTFASQPHRANARVVLAELGSLSVEFTRLAQITKEAKYYDAVARITIEFEKWQNQTKMPGLWPQKVDASGCKKEDISPASPVGHSMQKGAGVSQQLPQSGQLSGQYPDEPVSVSEDDSVANAGRLKHQVKSGAGTGSIGEDELSQEHTTKTEFTKRQLSDDELTGASPMPKPDCVPQGLASPPYSSVETFTLGGQADSVYEYLPKEYMLLGGLETQYQSMYEMSIETTKKYLLFRPMIPDEKRDILFAGQVSTSGHLDDPNDIKLRAEGTHLTCFVGGMFAIGAKIFNRKADLELAKKLTDGCVWAYESTTTGIMPEHFLALPCTSREKCPWNETAYWEALDPYKSIRVPSPANQVVLEQKESTAKKDKTGVEKSEVKPEATEAPAVSKGNVSDGGTSQPSVKSVVKRQLEDIADEISGKLSSSNADEAPTVSTRAKSEASIKAVSAGDSEESLTEADSETSLSTKATTHGTLDQVVEDAESATATKPEIAEYTQPPIPTQEEYAKGRIREERLPPGIVRVTGSKYILRPEAIESVFIMWRTTGDVYWREKGWQMFEAIQKATASDYGASAIFDVTSETPTATDEMESFWLAETLKYFYLLFSDPAWISLDDYVLNTEAHAFKRPNIDGDALDSCHDNLYVGVMDFEVSYTLENEQQFWDELDEIVSAHCETHELIDNALRSYLNFTTNYKAEYIQTEYGIARCSYKLLESPLFAAHKEYIRRQIEDSADTLHFIIAFLLYDGQQNEVTFEMMGEEGAFPRLVGLIQERKDDDTGLHRMLLELLYEMSRIQRLRLEDLMLIEDDFVTYMFDIIEGLSEDVNDPYHYPVIRVLLVLNEQYMVFAHDPSPDQSPNTQLTNKVIKVLSLYGSACKTFGENIILLLNRESETSLQLLILKLLYLLFTTPSTYEYFYTNDLRVLVDVMIRNLLDLPLSSTSLRHTYLRVLYPLLAHTQLKHPPHYKRDEILRLLSMMTSDGGTTHFGAVDETTKRLVARCVKVKWLQEDAEAGNGGPGNELVAKKLLGVELPSAMASALSVVEVAAHKEKPGVQTPSRRDGLLPATSTENGTANGQAAGRGRARLMSRGKLEATGKEAISGRSVLASWIGRKPG